MYHFNLFSNHIQCIVSDGRGWWAFIFHLVLCFTSHETGQIRKSPSSYLLNSRWMRIWTLWVPITKVSLRVEISLEKKEKMIKYAQICMVFERIIRKYNFITRTQTIFFYMNVFLLVLEKAHSKFLS